MKDVKTEFGKQQVINAKLDTENQKTHDAKPTTLNAKQETYDPRGPTYYFL